MPLYDYVCDACGDFDDWQPMSRASEPVPCPHCGAPAPRAISAPFLAMMPSNRRIAHERNEKAAHEPMVVSRAELDKLGRKRAEVVGCAGHRRGRGDHHHAHAPGGYRVHKSSRPWLIGH